MNISAEKYNATIELPIRLAQILIDKIKSIEYKKHYDLVVDIGSGSGNMTAKYAESIDCNRLIGLDVDPKMVEFAKKNNRNERIDFLQCNLEQPWDKMSAEVKQLEGKCSMVYASSALHWMSDAAAVASNISRLPAVASRLFLLILDLHDAFIPSNEHSTEFYSMMPMLEGDNFINKWKEELQRHQIQIDTTEKVAVDFTVTTQHVQRHNQPLKTLLNKYLPKDVELDAFLEKFPELISHPELMSFRKTGQLDAKGQEVWTKETHFWVLTATKL